MQKTVSLTNNKEFKRIYNRGKSLVNSLLVLYYMENELSLNRLGITVSKKLGKAVVRNRVRRIIKESYRLKELYIREGYDIIFVARVQSRGASYKQISSAMDQLLKRAELIKQ